MEELDTGRRLSLRYPNRYEPVQPLYKRALFVQTGVVWMHLQVYDLPPLPTYYHFGSPARTTIIWLGSRQSLDKIAVYEPQDVLQQEDQTSLRPVVCKLNEVHVGRSLNILKQPIDGNSQHQRQEYPKRYRRAEERRRDPKELYMTFGRLNLKGNESPSPKEPAEDIREVKVLFPRLFIITDRQILWLPLTDCSQYNGFEECLESKDPHCGWSWRDGQCVNGYDERNPHTSNWFNTFSPSIDRRRAENAQCPLERPFRNQDNTAWSPWYRCRWMDVEAPLPDTNGKLESTVRAFSKALGFCQCRVCLSQSECILGTQQVINCTRSERYWLQWSIWSPCNLKTGVQTRERKCRTSAVCVGSSREQRLCSDVSVWSSQLQNNKMPGKLSFSPQTPVTQSSIRANLNGGAFSATYMLLIAVCCLFVGIFITTCVFCLFPRLSNTCKSDGHTRCAICRSVKEDSSFFRQYSERKENQPNPANKCWNEVETDKVDWNEKHFEPCDRSQDTDSRYQTFFEKPPMKNKLDRLDRKQPCFSRMFASSQQQLLSGSPVPSPLSIPSGPSTASTLIPDKFTFEHLGDQPYYPPDDSNTPLVAKAPFVQPRPVAFNLTHAKSSHSGLNQYATVTDINASTGNPSVGSSPETINLHNQ